MYCPKCGSPLGAGGVCSVCGHGKSPAATAALAVGVPAVLLLVIFLGLPFCSTLLLAVQDYSVARGMLGSPFVGFRNFQMLFSSAQFWNILGNSFVQGLLSLVLGGGYVFAASYGVACVRNRWLRCGIVSALLLPALLPAISVALRLSPQAFLQNPTLYPILPILHEVFCIAPVVVAAGMFVRGRGTPSRTALFVAGCYVCVRLALLLSGDAQFRMLTYNPLVYETADTFSTYQYRTGFQQGGYSVSAALFVIRWVFQLLPAAAGAFGLIWLSRRPARYLLAVKGKSAGILAALPFALIGMIICVLVLVRGAGGVNVLGVQQTGLSLFWTFVYAMVGCMLAGLVALSLSCAMSAGGRIGAGVAICVGVAFLLCTGNMTGQYLQMRQMQLLNNAFAVVLQYMLYGVFGAFLLFTALGGQTEDGLLGFLRRIVGPGIALFGIAFAVFYGNTMVSMQYLRDPVMYPIGMLLRQILVSSANEDVAVSTLVVDLVPVLIGVGAVWLGGLVDRLLHREA